MSKNNKIKKLRITLVILIVVLFLCVLGLVSYNMFFQKNDNAQNKVTDSIPEYGYTLEKDQPKIYRDLFNELKNVLSKDEVDYDKYAQLISRMAVIDFYNLDNKDSKNDVGAVQFIRKDNVSNFVLEASETVYKYIEVNTDGKRNQNLPIVTSSEVISTKNEKYSYKKIKDDNAYAIEVGIGYKEDLGYPKKVLVKLLHSDKKLEIYSMK